MDFKSLISKIDSIESTAPAAPKLTETKKVQLDEETAIKFLAGTKSLNEAAEIMEKKLTKAEKAKKEEVVKSMKKDKKGFEERYGERGEEVMHATATKIAKKKAESKETEDQSLAEGGLDMNLIKAAQKGQEGKPIGKPDPESDKNVTKKYGYRMDGEPAERDDDETKQDRRGRKRKNTGEGIDLEGFRADFLALVEAKKKESKKKKPDADGDGVPDWADKKPGEDDNAAKKTEKKSAKGLSAKQKKLPPGLQKAIAAKKGKKPMKESLDEFFFPDDSEGGSDGEGKSGKDKIVNVQGEDFILRDTPEGMLLIGDDIEGSWYSSQDGAERTGAISFVVNLTKGKIVEFPDDFDVDYGYLNDEDVEDYIKMVAREVDMKQAKGESSDLDELFYFDGPDSKKKDRGEDELARREKGGHKATDPSYKQKDDTRYGGRYKIGGPKGKLPEAQAPTYNVIDIKTKKSVGTFRDGAGFMPGPNAAAMGYKPGPEAPNGTRVDYKQRVAEAQRRYKKVVAESRETKLSFRDMIKLVHESGGQQQIDPLDKNLFAWATRVAKNKFEESTKAEVYAGLVYERMGGRFEMYDVLSESRKKKINEEVDPNDIEELLDQYRNGDIDYAELKDKLDGLEHTDYSMRQGELGNPDMRDQMAWDNEKNDWNDEDEKDDWEDDFRESLTVQTKGIAKVNESSSAEAMKFAKLVVNQYVPRDATSDMILDVGDVLQLIQGNKRLVDYFNQFPENVQMKIVVMIADMVYDRNPGKDIFSKDDFRESLTVQTEVKKKLSESDKPVSELSVSTLKSYQDKAISGKDIWKNPKKSYLNRISGIGRSQEKIDKKQANEGSWQEDRRVYDRDAIAGAIESIYDEFIESEKFQRSYNEPVSRFERRYEPWLDLIEKFFSSDRTVEEIADRLHYYQREPNVRSFLKWVLRGGHN